MRFDELQHERERTQRMMDEQVDPEDGAVFEIGFVAELIASFDVTFEASKVLKAHLEAANARIAELEAQLAAHNQPTHEVIDDYGDDVTAVTP